MTSLLIRDGLLVTMDPSRRILRGDLFAADGAIRAVGEGVPAGADTVIDASGKIVLPGFVQVHVHLCQALFRGLADDMDVVDWLRTRIWPLEQAHDAESVYDSARLAIAEMMLGGTTCALTIETVHHTASALQAVVDTGFRATCGKAMMDAFEIGTEMLGETTEESLAEARDLLDRFHGTAGGRVRYALSPRGTRNGSPELWRRVRDLAQTENVLIHTHAAENREQTTRLAQLPGGRDVVYLHDLGVLGPNTVLAHCVWVTPEEQRLLAASDTRVAHCPSANLKLASGIAPVPQMLEQGITVALGADGAPCNNAMDMFREMRHAALIHKPGHGPQSADAATVLEMATIGGARALGLDDEIGSLEVGKRADLTVLDLDAMRTRPRAAADPISTIVYACAASDVHTVVIDGHIVVEDGRLTAMDPFVVAQAAETSLMRVLERAGLS